MYALNRFLVVALVAGLAAGMASAQTRMQVTAATPIRARAEVSSPELGTANPGEIVFVLSTSGTFSAIEPPERVGLWVNRDFIEGNRVIAKSVQLRTGPGLEHDVAGSLSRGAAIMKLSEQGEWLQISPPSSSQVYVLSSMLKAVPVATEPIGEVETVGYAPAAASEPVPAALPAAAPVTAPIAAAPVVAAPAAPAVPPVAVAAPPPTPAHAAAPTPKIAPSVPGTEPVKKPIELPAPIPPERVVATSKTLPAAPASAPQPAAHTAAPTRPIRPAVAGKSPAQPVRPAAQPVRPPAQGVSVPGAVLRPNPPAASAPAAAPLPAVDEALVRQLSLDPAAKNQGKRVRVAGELRQDPFRSKSPSRFRLLSRDGGSLEVFCDVHGDSNQLRPFIGKKVTLRGQAYRIEDSDVPVVVVGQVLPDAE